MILSGGYRIYTTVDTRVQDLLDEVYETYDFPTVLNEEKPQSAFVITEPNVGHRQLADVLVEVKVGRRLDAVDVVAKEYTTFMYAQDPVTQEWVELQRLSSENGNRIWVDFEQLPESLLDTIVKRGCRPCASGYFPGHGFSRCYKRGYNRWGPG